MDDSLHSRIAATLAGNWPSPWHGSDRQHKQVFDLADAVIAALGLRDDVDCSDDGKTYLHRYCTEWRPTEITDDLRRRFLQQMTQDAADDDAYEQFNGFVDTREETSD